MQGRIARFRRRLFPGGNPLARFGDRVEAALLLLLVVGALLTLPFAAAVGSDTYAAQTARAEQERTTRHPATATSLAAAATQTYSTDGRRRARRPDDRPGGLVRRPRHPAHRRRPRRLRQP